MTVNSSQTATQSPKKRRAAKAPTESSLFVNSVEKAFRVLSVFNHKHRRLSLSQIAQLSTLDLSATQRFTFTLQHLGFLMKDEESKLYELSPRMLDLSHQYISSNDSVSRATPFLQQLAIETEETVNFSTLDNNEIVYLQRIVSRHVLTPEVIVGTRLPAYCTSSGLAMLAALPTAEAEAILDASELVPYTQHTIYDKTAILKRLEAIRLKGYAHAENELYLGDISTAVAIVNSDNRPVGAINIAVSLSRWKGPEEELRIAALLIEAGRAISSRE
ncbi:MAG: IclR family transcriptional regulator [Paenalcaligenes sp.]